MPEGVGRLVPAVVAALVLATGVLAAVPSAERQEAPAASPATPDIEHARAVLTRVLARPEFARSPVAAMMERLRRRIAAWFLRTWDRLVGRRIAPRLIALTFAWIVALSALSILAAWVARAVMRQRPHTSLAQAGEVGHRASSRRWARDALAAADPREAVRCLYNAAICRLEEEGAWEVDDARTAREYVRLLPRDHARRPVIEDIAALFEQVWYKARPALPDDRARVNHGLEVLGCARSGRAI